MESDRVEGEVSEFVKALDQATGEYRTLYKEKLKFIKNSESKSAAVNMVFMRARDIERANANDGKRLFTFQIAAFDPENRRWDKCPGCGDPDINKETQGHPWQGCYKCEVLLGSNGTIKAMDPSRGRGGK